MEADAKRLQSKEEELMKKKQEIRNHLTQLKKDRRDLRTAVEAAAGEREGEKSIFKCWSAYCSTKCLKFKEVGG